MGRVDELAEVAELLHASRMVTVAGPGGVGKTRLAGEVAQRVADRFADGAWMVELAAVQDEALVPVAVAGALRLPLDPSLPAQESLAVALDDHDCQAPSAGRRAVRGRTAQFRFGRKG